MSLDSDAFDTSSILISDIVECDDIVELNDTSSLVIPSLFDSRVFLEQSSAWISGITFRAIRRSRRIGVGTEAASGFMVDILVGVSCCSCMIENG